MPKKNPGSKIDSLLEKAKAAFFDGDLRTALEGFQQAVKKQPNHAAAQIGLGAILHRIGRYQEARPVMERAVELQPDSAVAHDNLGVVLRLLGERNKSLKCHRKALKLDPKLANGRANYGLALEQLNRLDQAIVQYEKALKLDDKNLASLVGLGRIWERRDDDIPKAEGSFRAALKIDPDRITALQGLSNVLLSTGRHGEALRLRRRALKLRPQDVSMHLALGQALSTAARDNEAMAIYDRLRKVGVAGPMLWYGMAGACSNLGRAEEADHWYQQALTQDKDNRGMRSGYFFTAAASGIRSQESMVEELGKWEAHPGLPKPVKRRRRRPLKNRPLRVGYLSPDFRQHVVRQFFEPVLWRHDPENIEVYCYSETKRPDFATFQVRWVADRWFRTHGVTDEDVAQQIADDQIDILVDLAGHTAHNRLGVMTYRPAPVQATYLGYFGSTGLSTIDYWITDPVIHPEDTDEPAIETIWRLPRCGFSYGVPRHAPPVAERKPRKHVVFGCFNNVSKAGLDVVDTWAEILRRVPRSRLILKDRRFGTGRARQVWKKRFQRRGINLRRIEFRGNSPHPEYMNTYNEIDIALDPFPRTGGTTTCDALWMSVPVVTLAGKRYVTRLSTTKLTAVGVPELVTHSPEAYIEKAVELAKDPAMRAEYHATLRGKMKDSPLCDPASLAKALEAAYREMVEDAAKRRPR